MTARTRSLATCAQYTALALILSLPAYAQELPTEMFWADEARHQELKGATITVQTLARAHQSLISRLGKLSYTADSAGNSVMPPLLSHLLSNSSIVGYSGSDAPYLPTAAREWSVRHRVCADPSKPDSFVVLTWLDRQQFRRGIGARQLQAAPRAYYETVDGTFDVDSQIGVLVPLARSGGSVRYSYEPFSGAATSLPDCALGTAAGEWSDGTGLPGFEAAALLTTLPLPNLALRWQATTEYRNGICPPANAPELTIADDGKVLETRQRRTLVDNAGRPVLMTDQKPVPVQLTNWTYESGCRAPRRQTVTLLQNCTYRTMGVDLQGQRVYLVDTEEAVPPAPYTEPAGLGQEKWLIRPGTTPRLISDGCTGEGTLPTISTTVSESIVSEAISCTSRYAPPSERPDVPYTLGEAIRERTKTTYTTVFPAESGLDPIKADSYSPWRWGADSCHRKYQTYYDHTNTEACAEPLVGEVYFAAQGLTETVDYAGYYWETVTIPNELYDPRLPSWYSFKTGFSAKGVPNRPTITVTRLVQTPGSSADYVTTIWSTGWYETGRSCTRSNEIIYTGGGGGGSGGGGGESYYDVDGDGKGDFSSLSQAAAAGFSGNNGIAGNYPTVNNYSPSQGVQSQVSYSQSSSNGNQQSSGNPSSKKEKR